MILIDTSVWVEFFNKRHRLHAVDLDDDIVTCPPIIQEVLQGFRDERAYAVARESMCAMPCLEAPLEREVFVEAAELHRLCRRLGVTIRSSVDCVIAICAIRHDAEVLHVDRDFDALAKVAPLRARRLR